MKKTLYSEIANGAFFLYNGYHYQKINGALAFSQDDHVTKTFGKDEVVNFIPEVEITYGEWADMIEHDELLGIVEVL